MRLIAFLSIMALAACAHASGVSGRYDVDHVFSVQLERPWADVSNVTPRISKRVHLLTLQGRQLESLYLVGGLAPGDPLIGPARGEENPRYHGDFSSTEMVEFVDGSLGALGYVGVTPHNIRTGRLANQAGVRFDIEMQTVDGLEVLGGALVSQSGGRLNLILFFAPREYYYPTLMPEIDRMMLAAGAS